MAVRGITRIYRFTSAEVHNQIAQVIGELTPKLAERPERAVELINGMERLRGQAETLEELEKVFVQIEDWAVSQGWTAQQILLCQYDEVASIALRPPGDDTSGRSGDGRRSYADGRRDVLRSTLTRLRNNEWFPGNEKKESK